MDKRFIEDSFPVMEVSEESANEKNIRQGHISTLHIWWARRPLASSRATNYAALIPEPSNDEEREEKRNFIIELSKWKNSLNPNIIKKAKNEILKVNNGVPPKILDPFSGGGTIPLESLRLGCETYANDYNPVAVLIENCTIKYPQKYGKSKIKKWSEKNNSLVEDVRKWQNWILNNIKKDIGKFYPKGQSDSVPIFFIWARTLPCQNPTCGTEIPLMKQFWLAKKDNKKIALKPLIANEKIEFEVVGQEDEIPADFDPSEGTINNAIVTCPACKTPIEAKTTKKLFENGKSGERLVAIAETNPDRRGKKYRVANENDKEIFKDAEDFLVEKRKVLKDKWGIEPIPDEPLPPIGTLGFRVQRYGLLKWGDLFNSRQKLVLISFIEYVHKTYEKMLKEGYNEEYSKVLITFLSLKLGKLADWNSTLSRWRADQERNEDVFSRNALPMIWDYGERNPLEGRMLSPKGIDKIIEHCTNTSEIYAKITQNSATNLPYPDNYFDGVFTDPPYYDNVPYSHLSDFFYVWHKRALGKYYPELFSTPLTPKTEEIVAYTHFDGGFEKGKEFFEDMLKKSFQEIFRVLKKGGITTIVYAHKTTAGWETVINALLDSGLTVTASWPLSTEMRGRHRSQKSAALASSIYIVARKLNKKEIGWFNEIKEEIKRYIPEKLNKLWNENIVGANFFVAAIGSAIEIFGRYEKIMDFEGNEVRADKLLSFVRDVVTDYSVRHILHNGIADELSPLTKFYLLWRWNYQDNKVPFDEARKLAQSAGIDLANEWNKGFITKRGEKIGVIGPEKRKEGEIVDSMELIDVLHKSLILWSKERKDEMNELLQITGWGNREAFYKVGQAVSETLPDDSKEKKLLDGFLPTKRKFYDSKGTKQTTLDGGNKK